MNKSAVFVAVVAATANAVSLKDTTVERLTNIALVNGNPTSTWKAAKSTRFDGMKMDEIKRMMGALQIEATLPEKTNFTVSAEDLPTEFDAATNWTKCPGIAKLVDQSNCGSCWSMSTSTAASDRFCIHSNGLHQERLSHADALACCGGCGYGCEGGYPAEAVNWFASTGIVTGDNYDDFSGCYSYPFPSCGHYSPDYSPSCKELPSYKTPKCTRTCDAKSTKLYLTDKHFFKRGYSVRGVQAMKAELFENGPYNVAFTVYSDFIDYKSGIYTHKSGNRLGGHAVTLVGWGIENGVEYWKIRNSWNESWGEQGHFRVRVNEGLGFETSGVTSLPLF